MDQPRRPKTGGFSIKIMAGLDDPKNSLGSHVRLGHGYRDWRDHASLGTRHDGTRELGVGRCAGPWEQFLPVVLGGRTLCCLHLGCCQPGPVTVELCIVAGVVNLAASEQVW